MDGASRGGPSQRWKCLLLSHKYVRLRYPDSPDGYYLQCARCGREREESGYGFAGGMDVGS